MFGIDWGIYGLSIWIAGTLAGIIQTGNYMYHELKKKKYIESTLILMGYILIDAALVYYILTHYFNMAT